jgi:hypothetical protein
LSDQLGIRTDYFEFPLILTNEYHGKIRITMRGLLVFPSEVWAIMSGYLTLLEFEALFLTGSSLLITKLKSGGIDILQAPRWIPTGMCDKIKAIPICSRSQCAGCFRGLLHSYRMARTIIYDADRHSVDWCLNVLLTPYIQLNRLELTLKSSVGVLLDKISSNQVIVGDVMPQLEHLALNCTGSGSTFFSGDSMQFMLGMLPRTLKSFSLHDYFSPMALRLHQLLVELPPLLETLGMGLLLPEVWPVQVLPSQDSDWKALCRLKKQPNIGDSLYLKSQEALETPIFELQYLLPRFLHHAQVTYRAPSPFMQAPKEPSGPLQWSFPRNLESLTIHGSPTISSGWLPTSLTSLNATNATILWEEGSLPNLKSLKGTYLPAIPLPHVRSLHLTAVLHSLYPANSVSQSAKTTPVSDPEMALQPSESSPVNTGSIALLPPLVSKYIPFGYGHILTTLTLPSFILDLQTIAEHRAILLIPSLTSITICGLAVLTPSTIILEQPLDEDPLACFVPALAPFPPKLTFLSIIRAQIVPRCLLALIPDTIKEIKLSGVATVEQGAMEKSHFERFASLETLYIIGTHPPQIAVEGSNYKAPSTEWFQELVNSLPKQSLRSLELQWCISPLRHPEMALGEKESYPDIEGASERAEAVPFPKSTLSPSLDFPLPYLTELVLPHALMTLPHFLRLPSSLTSVEVAGVLVRSTFHLTLLPSITTRLPSLNASTIPIRISFAVLGYGHTQALWKPFESVAKDLPILLENLAPLDKLDHLPLHLLRSQAYRNAMTTLCTMIIQRPEFAHLERLLAHLQPGMFQFSSALGTHFGFLVEEP